MTFADSDESDTPRHPCLGYFALSLGCLLVIGQVFSLVVSRRFNIPTFVPGVLLIVFFIGTGVQSIRIPGAPTPASKLLPWRVKYAHVGRDAALSFLSSRPSWLASA
jgi:hypothetical protein